MYIQKLSQLTFSEVHNEHSSLFSKSKPPWQQSAAVVNVPPSFGRWQMYAGHLYWRVTVSRPTRWHCWSSWVRQRRPWSRQTADQRVCTGLLAGGKQPPDAWRASIHPSMFPFARLAGLLTSFNSHSFKLISSPDFQTWFLTESRRGSAETTSID